VEGFVNQYMLDGTTSNAKTLVFVSESIENIPAGWRARETYHLLSNDEFIEVFELAAPGKEFEVYSENRFRRLIRHGGMMRKPERTARQRRAGTHAAEPLRLTSWTSFGSRAASTNRVATGLLARGLGASEITTLVL